MAAPNRGGLGLRHRTPRVNTILLYNRYAYTQLQLDLDNIIKHSKDWLCIVRSCTLLAKPYLVYINSQIYL